jgi:hypothetical protein
MIVDPGIDVQIDVGAVHIHVPHLEPCIPGRTTVPTADCVTGSDHLKSVRLEIALHVHVDTCELGSEILAPKQIIGNIGRPGIAGWHSCEEWHCDDHVRAKLG